MKIGIMQPYFFSYLPYYQLINTVDIYVNLDHVSFIKGGYMTRNTLKNGIKFNIPCSGASQNKSCREVNVIADDQWTGNIIKTLHQTYGKEKNFCPIMDEVLSVWFEDVRRRIKYTGHCSISDFNITSIICISEYLDIKTKIVDTSLELTDKKKNEGLQEITKHFGGDTYINAIGGQKLYTKEDFATQGIDLKFIKNKSELPNTSILDLLFRYDKEIIKQELNNYELI